MPNPSLAEGVASLEREVTTLRLVVDEKQTEVRDLLLHQDYDRDEIKILRGLIDEHESRVEEKIVENVQLNAALGQQKLLYESIEEVHAKVEIDLRELRKQQAISEGLRKSMEGDITRLRDQVDNLVTLVRAKTREAWVFSIALRSAYELISSLPEKKTFRSLLDRANNTTRDQLIEKLLEALLLSANVRLQDVNNPGLASPVSPSRGREPREAERNTKKS
ncbi:hypothetical protein G7Z17_g3216 [Cylindrodendrum hubeiense]|uniref:Uncharacterized protein n=1 Tax=Cylindrodendrum hubeiense TaxID=595255 RepID=A0A9P5HLK2_9HYPO|nr:hypothetical protein G7Z17_g3216 [Cylindrodendrum hubeiense]